MNSEISKTSQPHVLILKLIDKLDLRRGEKGISLSNLSIYDAWENITGSYSNSKFKITALKKNVKFQLPDGSNSISNIQEYFKYNFKNIIKRLTIILPQEYILIKVKIELHFP